jgi:hypothetical protein
MLIVERGKAPFQKGPPGLPGITPADLFAVLRAARVIGVGYFEEAQPALAQFGRDCRVQIEASSLQIAIRLPELPRCALGMGRRSSSCIAERSTWVTP